MSKINQTNRTILFDVINPEVIDLFTLMADVDDNASSLTDEKIEEINKALLADSFDDFLRKFKPTIYSYFDENMKMHYELMKPSGIPDVMIKEIPINKSNHFLKMFIAMMDRKRTSNTTNVSFDYEKVTEILAPNKVLNEIRQLKKEIQYLEKRNAELAQDSPGKLDAAKKLESKYKATEKYYNETSAQISLMVGMIKENLLLAEKAGKEGGVSAAPRAATFKDGELTALPATAQKLLELSSKGSQIGMIEARDTVDSDGEKNEEGAKSGALMEVGSGQNMLALAGAGGRPASSTAKKIDFSSYTINTLEKRYDDGMDRIYKSVGQEYDRNAPSLQRELVVSAFTDKMSMALVNMENGDKVSKYNDYSQINTAWQKAFIRTAKLLLEKILNVKAFFDQYTVKSPKMRPKLLIVNSRLENIVEDSNLKKLQLYLETVNNKTDCDKAIWFGIVPDIKFAEENEMEIDIQTLIDLGYIGDLDDGMAVAPNEISCLQQLLDGIRNYKIQTFFSFETCEDTTFSRLSTRSIQGYMDKTVDIDGSDYSMFAIPCLPNFTVIPRDKSKVVLGSKVEMDGDRVQFSKDSDDQYRFWIYGVYVGAAYVAAGLVAAYQCPSYLSEKFGGRILRDSPGVRFDIEESDHSQKVTTTFARETSGITIVDKGFLDRDSFGFVFSSDRTGFVSVYNARCLWKDDVGYANIFRETTKTYLSRMIRILSDDNKKDGIEKLYAAGGKVRDWQISNGYVNSILREKDLIEPCDYEGRNGSIRVTFSGMSERIEVEIKG